MFLLPYACLLIVSSVRAELEDLAYTSTCRPDQTGKVGIDLKNGRPAPVKVVLVCWEDTHTVTVEPFFKLVFPAVFFARSNQSTDTCVFSPSAVEGTESIYLVISQASNIVIDDWLYCDTGTNPPRPVIQLGTTCEEDETGQVVINLYNNGDISLYFYIECWVSVHELTVHPGYVTVFPATFYKGDLDYGNDVYGGAEDELCAFWPWIQDGTQNVFVATQALGQGHLSRLIYCKTKYPLKSPDIVFTTSCHPDYAGLFDVDIANRGDDLVTVEVLCHNEWYTRQIEPHSSVTLPSTFNRGYRFQYIPRTCVFQIFDSRVEEQLIWVFGQGTGEEFRTDFVTCSAGDPPAFRHTTSCLADTFGLVPIRLENNRAFPMKILLECWLSTHTYTLDSLTTLTVSSVFYDGSNGTYPHGVCVFQPWTDDGIQGLYVIVKKSNQLVRDNYIYCDTRAQPPKPLELYEHHCFPDAQSLAHAKSSVDAETAVITFLNTRNVPLTFTVGCMWNAYTVKVGPNSTAHFTAAFYKGGRAIEEASGEEAVHKICTFRPRLVDGTQDLIVTSEQSGGQPLPHVVYCLHRLKGQPPKVQLESSCIPNERDVLTITLKNKDNSVVHIWMTCANDEYIFRLNGLAQTTFPAVFYRGEDVFYPPGVCMLKNYELLHGNNQFMWIFAENGAQTYKPEYFFCRERKPLTLHRGLYSSNCEPDTSGRVSVLLANEGETTLRFFVRCGFSDHELVVNPLSNRTFLAAYDKGYNSSRADDTCVFLTLTSGIQTVVIAIEESPQDYTLHFMHCSVRSGTFQPLVHTESVCRSDEPGKIFVNLRNSLNVPMVFRINCWHGEHEVELAPNSTSTLPAAYYAGADVDYNACVLHPWSASGWQVLFVSAVLPDGTSLASNVYCKASQPSSPPVVKYHSDCRPDNEGIMNLHMENNDIEPVRVSLACSNDWFNQTLAPGASKTFPMLFDDGEEIDVPLNTCVLLDGTDFFLKDQYVWIFTEKSGGQYNEENVFCSKKSAKITDYSAKTAGPIMELISHCPDTISGIGQLELRADVPISGLASCRNGNKKFRRVDEVSYFLIGHLNQNYSGEDCLFYKKERTHTYTVDVALGWAEPNNYVFQRQKVKTVTCAYNEHGRAITSKDKIADWFLNPQEKQHLLGQNLSRPLQLKLVDVLGEELNGDHITLGKVIRLKAMYRFPGKPASFKALSCDVSNNVTSYKLIRAGCGDGLVFSKAEGFMTDGQVAYSPYFTMFKLSGGDQIRFTCEFALCTTRSCDGDSCSTVTGAPRSTTGNVTSLVHNQRINQIIVLSVHDCEFFSAGQTNPHGHPKKPSNPLLAISANFAHFIFHRPDDDHSTFSTSRKDISS